eukprot:7692371-Prorocentrum_lima.AAC.1
MKHVQRQDFCPGGSLHPGLPPGEHCACGDLIAVIPGDERGICKHDGDSKIWHCWQSHSTWCIGNILDATTDILGDPACIGIPGSTISHEVT